MFVNTAGGVEAGTERSPRSLHLPGKLRLHLQVHHDLAKEENNLLAHYKVICTFLYLLFKANGLKKKKKSSSKLVLEFPNAAAPMCHFVILANLI